MHEDTYLVESARTLSEFKDGIHLSQLHTDMLHASIGIGTETAELLEVLRPESRMAGDERRKQVVLECGDLLWYIALALRTCNMRFEDVYIRPLQSRLDDVDGYFRPESGSYAIVEAMALVAGDILDIMKRTIFYGKPIDEDKLATALGTQLRRIDLVLQMFDWTFEEAMQLNIEKLKVRFPDKFNGDDAVNRDTKAEEGVADGYLPGAA